MRPRRYRLNGSVVALLAVIGMAYGIARGGRGRGGALASGVA
jgi:hypothetical protein